LTTNNNNDNHAWLSTLLASNIIRDTQFWWVVPTICTQMELCSAVYVIFNHLGDKSMRICAHIYIERKRVKIKKWKEKSQICDLKTDLLA
jgi:hypothetical protein